MRVLTAALLGFVLAVSSLPPGALRADEYGREGNLEIWIRTDKKIYERGEPIFVTFTLKNRTTEALTLNRRWGFLQEVDLEVFKDPDGPQTFRAPKPAPPFQKKDFSVLMPGKDLEMRLDINEYFPASLGPGAFALRASYQNGESGKAFGLDAWTGKIFSNQVNIQVRPSQPV